MSWLSDLFSTPAAPTAPDYSPFIGNAQTNSAAAWGNVSKAGNQSDWITGQAPLAWSGYGNAATYSNAANDIMQQQMAWARNAYAQNQGQITPIINAATNYMDTQANNAATDRAFYEGTYQPMMKSFADYANNYASDARKDLMRGRAMADVAQNTDAARESSTRELESFGINPGATRYGGLDVGVRTAQAAAQAAAANQSDLATEQQGAALRQAAIQQGAVLPGQSVGETNAALGAGSLAGNEALALTNSGANTMGTGATWSGVGQGWGSVANQYLGSGTGMSNSGVGWTNAGANWGGVGNSALNIGGNLTNQGFQNNLDAAKFAQNSSTGIGTMLGTAAGIGLKMYTGGIGIPGFGGGSGSGGGWNTPKPAGQFTPWGFAEGGPVPPSASPSAGVAIDDVPARLTPGEFVMPRDVVAWEGEKGMQAIVEKARKAKIQAISGPGAARPQTRQALPVGQHPAFVSRPPQRAAALPVG